MRGLRHERLPPLAVMEIDDQRTQDYFMETAADLREKAAGYRAMAKGVIDQRLIDALLSLAVEYELLADRIERDGQGSE